MAAWRAWKNAARFEDISWQEIRLLGPVYARLPELDPETPLRPRIDGILKNRWVLAQLKLRETYDAFAALLDSGIPVLVFKGGAYQAEGLAMANRRVIGDVDILIRHRDAVGALERLEASGWTAANGESFEYLRRLATVRLNGNFRKGHHGNVDLHVSPFHYSRNDASLDEALWMRAGTASLGPCRVRVPDPTDSVLIVLAHATESSNGDWTMDVATRMAGQHIDWDRLVETAGRRGIVPACLAGLAYLSWRIGLPVPGHVLAAFSAARVPVSQRLKYWSNVRDRGERGLAEKIANRLADAMLSRDGFSVVVKDHSAITVARPTLSPRAFIRQARPSLVPASVEHLDYRHHLAGLRHRSHLVLKLGLDRPGRSRRLFFDVCVDGVAIARLRARSGGGHSKAEVTKLFRIPLPERVNDTALLSISARPTHFLRPGATQAEIDRFGRYPFRVAGVWAV
ncbi:MULTISPECIES: nucleotidyltransferase family protein [unclassified Mesorhizobium]|uniref:nucleotidyltransferase family protein n=1 Tax=unclassified Mesorhizobium TaxID=325217 RepID=UPI000FC9C259|nr:MULTISPECIES: nucleotidyltransferase family protein [unclassified Mesorhizobium]TGP21949.1 hypothetical protein EN874_020955 [Mesorhizobium sp. M1D.F.Ca.ET.231.01.1.1]TGP30334.1 hypothetical protein EN877_19335 [Mesorhizobium sp. M1D.F.Ca.ET.234.01.1.1]TGS44410.1 hypothetical protein EN827_19330 [Mesorhizobium sp. M1D.F.Ca.ET.184.01.1.1]TGS60450.1 hypothetical protein EN826_019330 [Mesorhizobium sp. M1D.F.Ca.ET.183.01.1.1]